GAPQAQPRPEDQMRIVADPATNSLVVFGTAQEFQNIKNILRELDAVPRQVLLDVFIAEVTLKEHESLGVDYQILTKDRVTIFGQTFGSRGALRTLGQLFPNTDFTNTAGGGLTGIVGGNTVQALINALKTDSRVKILSSPSVLATDNRPARIQVGSEEPIATGQLIAATGATTPSSSTSIQYRNTGRIVTIIPQVNSQGLVNLQILAEVSQRGVDVKVGQDTFPAFDTRQAETTAVVQDGDSLVIGGIIADNRARSRTGIPYMMDIPVIGRFFATNSDEILRTELIMLITPHVIYNRDQGQQVTEDFKKSLATVRNELDRIARERQKLQQQPLEQPQTPSLPGPSGDVVPPAPAPSAAPAAPQNPVTPLRQINSLSPVLPGLPQPPGGSVTAEVSRESEKIQSAAPAYALSLTRPVEPARPARPTAPVRPATPPLAAPAPPPFAAPRSTREWAVQVAALATDKDAQTMAEFLRKSGYDSYVMVFENQGKTWHRVRVGKFADVRSAMQLKNSLTDLAQFKQAYVAGN
ncbi:MAG TPA: SPOR domain-containing protein, partial [Candidatus Binatia bacterium]|nr:SPOR domain-containing protein [Candidatus Binatia bacterium]